jgi:hypothetical protein
MRAPWRRAGSPAACVQSEGSGWLRPRRNDRAEGPLGDDVGSLQKRGDPFDLERLCGHQFLERIVFDVDVPALLCHVGHFGHIYSTLVVFEEDRGSLLFEAVQGRSPGWSRCSAPGIRPGMRSELSR